MPPLATEARAGELLRQMYGLHADFRDGQLEAILATVDRRARTLLIQRTGWGKSLVYFVATKILREQGLGPTLLISPLLSLMRNQVEAAQRIGIRAARIDSETADTLGDVETALSRDEIDVLLVSQEPDPFPAWVTAVPSLRRPTVVPDFAERLAVALGLPFAVALEKVRDTPQQNTMENSAQQLANIAAAFGVVPGTIRPGVVLVVDDMVDSRWTFTEIAYALKSAGAGTVYPMALASTAGGGVSQ